jgi:hypothetical protein
MLSKKPMSFSEMLEFLGVSSSFLTYHLENLGELVGKIDDNKYRLSSFGEAAIATMTKVEDIPISAPQQSPKTKSNRVVGRSVAIALGIICIVLVAFLVGATSLYQSQINDKDNTITNLQKIAHARSLAESTVIVQDYLVGIFTPNSSTVVVSNNTVLPSNIVVLYWNGSSSNFNQIPSYHVDIDHAGYIVVNVTPSNSVVELEYSSNGFSYNNTVNLGNNTISVFPVIPTSTLTILVSNTDNSNVSDSNQAIDYPMETVTITYYF